jgi:hypothetical protein
MLVLVLGGCAAGEQPSSAPATIGSPEPSDRLASVVYPYAMAWPPDELETKWRPADTAWDGTSRVDHGNEYTDYVRTVDGHLFAFGFETTGDAEQLEALLAEQATEWHGCNADATEQEPLTMGGTDGILATYACGESEVLRWVGVRDGFGMAVILLVADDADFGEARDHFTDRLTGGLTWTN